MNQPPHEPGRRIFVQVYFEQAKCCDAWTSGSLYNGERVLVAVIEAATARDEMKSEQRQRLP